MRMLDATSIGSASSTRVATHTGAWAVATREAHGKQIVKPRTSEYGFIRETTLQLSRLLHPCCLSSTLRRHSDSQASA